MSNQDQPDVRCNEQELNYNPKSQWVRNARWRKRLDGFIMHILVAFTALIHPEAADAAVHLVIKDHYKE